MRDTYVYVARLHMCGIYADIHVSACDGYRYMQACMCGGYMRVHTWVCDGIMCILACECGMGAYLCMALCVLCAYVCTHVYVLVK